MEHHANSPEHHDTPSHSADIFDAIRSRRSIRKYKPVDVPWDNVVEILQAAKYAPFAGNIFNIKLVVVKNEAKRKAIAETCIQQYWMAEAPVHIVVVGEPEKQERYYGTRGERIYTVQGAGAAIQNMLLTAHTLGLGSCWVGAFDEEEIRRICNLPEHVNVQAVVTIGYPAENPTPPPKYRIENIMFFEKWWGRIESPRNALGLWAPAIHKGITATKRIVKRHAERIKEKVRNRLKKK